MQKLIRGVMSCVIFGAGFLIMHGCNDKSEKSTPEKTEKQLMIQETQSTNKKLSER